MQTIQEKFGHSADCDCSFCVKHYSDCCCEICWDERETHEDDFPADAEPDYPSHGYSFNP